MASVCENGRAAGRSGPHRHRTHGPDRARLGALIALETGFRRWEAELAGLYFPELTGALFEQQGAGFGKFLDGVDELVVIGGVKCD
jgi:hypothetical protein